MKITDVKLIPLRYPLKEPIRLAWGEMTHRQFALIQIETDEGITGIGETSVNFPAWSIVERKATVEQGIKPLPYSPHHYGSDVGFAASLHLLASTPGGLVMLRDVSPTPLREEVLLEPLRIEGGYAEVPQGPGLGVELNEEVISRFTFEL